MAKDNIKIDLKVDGVQDVNKATDAVKDLTAASKDSANAVKELGETSDLFSEIKSRVQGAISGVKAFANSFRTVKGAIAATGIGALLIAVTSLIAYFKNTEAGARALAIATAALGVIFDKITEKLATLGPALIETFEKPQEVVNDLKDLITNSLLSSLEGIIQFFPRLQKAVELAFKGKFKEAGKVAVDALIQVNTGIENGTDKLGDLGDKAKETFDDLKKDVEEAVEVATKLVDGTESLRKAINAVKVENAQLNRELETQKQIGEDTTKGYEERRAALIKAGEAQVAIANNSREEARLNLSLLQLQRSMTSNIEERKALDAQIADARATQIEAQTAYEIELQDVKKVTREIDLEELERVKAISDIIREANVDNTLSKFDAAIKQNKIDEEAALFELNLLKATEEEKQKVRDGFAKQRQDLDAERVEEEKQRLQAQVDLAITFKAKFVDVTKSEFDLKRDEVNKFYSDKAAKMKESLSNDLISQEAYDLLVLENTRAHNEEVAVIDTAALKAKEDEEVAARNRKLGASLNVLSAVSNLAELFAGKSKRAAKRVFKIQKATSLASAAINTYLGATSAFAMTPGGPIIKGIAAGLAVTAGLLNIKKIAATKFDDGKEPTSEPPITMPTLGGSGSVVSPQEAPVPPSMSLDNLNGSSSSTQSLSSGLGMNQQNTSIRAYVVEQDITETQNTLQQYKVRSEIG